MGLQTRLQSTPPLLSMACLDVETPSICRGKFKSVLQLCLQQRRTREQLVEQGIMPPLKTPATFHEQIRSLERARTGNFLKHKLCSRPQRSELVHMRILQETQAEPSLQATQMKQKRARLADNLNEKIAQRPSPMELVEKNILPVDPTVEEVLDGDKANSSKPAVIYSLNEDSSDALSPQQPANHQSPCSTSASPRESGGSDATSASSKMNSPIQPSPSPNSQSPSDSVNLVSTTEQLNNQKAPTLQTATTVARCATPGSGLMKQSPPKLPGDKSRSKRSKEPKPRVKKLKYHQYIPPDQKQELSEVQMDSAYARLLQQQQQFLHLQILSQQQSSYQPGPPPTVKPATEVQTSCSSVVPALVQLQHNQTNRKPDHLPANLDEMKVAELKMELKLRSLPVSGTKLDLIERLKLYQESANLQTAAAIDKTVVTAASQSENTKLSPPVSPIASKVSSMGIEDRSMADSPTMLEENMSPSHTAPCVDSAQECPMEQRSNEKDSEKDKRLHEKERQIEELIRKLEQEQRLVEELKMQLEVEKRSQQGDSPPHLVPIKVKDESRTPSNCSETCNSPGLPVLIKQEEAQNQCHLTLRSQFIISQQTIKQPVETGAHVLLPAALPATAVTIQLPASSITLHTNDSSAATGLIPGLLLASGQLPQKSESSAASQRRCSNQPPTKAWKVDSSAQSLLSTFRVSGCPVGDSSCQVESKDPKNKSPHSSQSAFLEQPKFTNHVSKCKDPPRYEDAVKQTRSMLSAVQGPTAASQEMDDLFDVLIESGEISPFIGQDITHQDKPLPVTASVTTLPINTVLSRPPPVVQVAQLPAAPLNSATSLADLPSASRLETILDGTLAACTEELRSAMAAVEVDFNESTLPPSLNLHVTNMDMDNMDWLDLSLSVPAEGVNSLDLSAQVGVFSSDFLDSHELQLNWE